MKGYAFPDVYIIYLAASHLVDFFVLLFLFLRVTIKTRSKFLSISPDKRNFIFDVCKFSHTKHRGFRAGRAEVSNSREKIIRCASISAEGLRFHFVNSIQIRFPRVGRNDVSSSRVSRFDTLRKLRQIEVRFSGERYTPRVFEKSSPHVFSLVSSLNFNHYIKTVFVK